MEKLFIKGTQNTPEVNFNPENGVFKIDGRSIPENPGDFYDPLLDWLIEYFENPASKTVFRINLVYVNSGSSKYLLGLFRVFKKKYLDGVSVEVDWYFEEDDEAIEGLGEHYQSLLPIPFNMKEYI